MWNVFGEFYVRSHFQVFYVLCNHLKRLPFSPPPPFPPTPHVLYLKLIFITFNYHNQAAKIISPPANTIFVPAKITFVPDVKMIYTPAKIICVPAKSFFYTCLNNYCTCQNYLYTCQNNCFNVLMSRTFRWKKVSNTGSRTTFQIFRLKSIIHFSDCDQLLHR